MRPDLGESPVEATWLRYYTAPPSTPIFPCYLQYALLVVFRMRHFLTVSQRSEAVLREKAKGVGGSFIRGRQYGVFQGVSPLT